MKLFVGILSLLMLVGVARAECTFKVVNHSNKTFQELGAKASISNLAIVLCSQLSQQDDVVKANCKASPNNTLFSHPHYPSTCVSTNGWPVYLQLENDTDGVCSDKQNTLDRDVVLNYPEDFSKEKCKF